MNPVAELALDAKAVVGEGVYWDADRQILYWVDILAKQVHLFDPATCKDRCIQLDQYIGAAVPTTDGDLMLAMHHGFARLNPVTEALTPVCDPEHHLPDNRFNDGKCDPAGRFWAGTMQLEGKIATGALYCLDPDFSVHKFADSIGISNGLAWGIDNETMYFIDTTQSEMVAFDYDIETGAISRRRTAIRFSNEFSHPDGMTIDEEGMVWVAFFGSGCVARWNPNNANLLRKIHFPVTLTTNCTFGGPELDTLYVSSCRFTLTPDELAKQPLAGGIFRVKLGVRGIRAQPFRVNRR